MVIIATSLYLPEHVITMSNRAFYYWSGNTQSAGSVDGTAIASSTSAAASSISDMVVNASQSIIAKGQSLVAGVANAAANVAAGSQNSGGAFQTPVEAVPVAGL